MKIYIEKEIILEYNLKLVLSGNITFVNKNSLQMSVEDFKIKICPNEMGYKIDKMIDIEEVITPSRKLSFKSELIKEVTQKIIFYSEKIKIEEAVCGKDCSC